ncbi:MAG TPA: ADP/ATP-dependent (S)-NAD(P)H-hydrate dehydratase, partial [Chroococcales cyanobacterium]
ETFPKQAMNFVLTPHPKELSRLMACSVAEIQADRIASARRAAQRFMCTIVLKGSRTVTADVAGAAFINPTGNSGMATAGSGDVLSGIIGSLMAQAVSAHEAAVAGVYIHGTAGDIAAQNIFGHAGITAGEISFAVPAAVSNIKQGMRSVLEDQLSGNTGDAPWQF